VSAPIVACALVEAIAPLLKTLSESLGAYAYVQYYPASDRHESFWAVSIHDHGKCFSGNDYSDPAQALMKANADRQAYAPVVLEQAA
jgi:hypothetical protein